MSIVIALRRHPVAKNENGDYTGVPAVIDKDFASPLAELVDADYLFILTAVDRGCEPAGRTRCS